MTDEIRGANRTDAGREAALDDHERRLEALEAWRQLAEYKAVARDRRAQAAVRYVVSLSIGVIIAVVSAFFAAGAHI